MKNHDSKIISVTTVSMSEVVVVMSEMMNLSVLLYNNLNFPVTAING